MSYPSELCVQLHHDRLPDGQLEEVVLQFGAIDEEVCLSPGEDEANYINIRYCREDLSLVWKDIGRLLRSNPTIANATIIVCTGSQGWDDHKLLHHFDRTLTLDHLS